MTDPNGLDQIPDHLKAKYIPRLKELFNEYAEYVEVFEASPIKTDKDPVLKQKGDNYTAHVEEVYDDFLADGGTEDQWNILAPTIFYSKFDP